MKTDQNVNSNTMENISSAYLTVLLTVENSENK